MYSMKDKIHSLRSNDKEYYSQYQPINPLRNKEILTHFILSTKIQNLSNYFSATLSPRFSDSFLSSINIYIVSY